MKTQTAAMLRVPCLYHFQSFNAAWLNQTLIDGKIYMSNPTDFNDPWDCRPWFNDEALDDPEFYNRQVEQLAGSDRKWTRPFDEDRHNAILYRLRTDRSFLQEKIRQISEGLWEAIGERYRVYCLSTKQECALMWAHYADKHRGVCLEFGVDEMLW